MTVRTHLHARGSFARRIAMTTQGSAVKIDDFLRAEGFDSEEALH